MTQDTTWKKLDSPYVLVQNVLVSQNITLTIEPGVHVVFQNFFMQVDGTLAARGTPVERIQMRGAGGDFTSPNEKYPIGNIYFTSESKPWDQIHESGSIIEYSDISFSGGRGFLIRNASPEISNSEITGGSHCVFVAGGNPIIVNNTISHCGSGITVVGEGCATIVGNVITQNSVGISNCGLTDSNFIFSNGVGIAGGGDIVNNKIVRNDHGIDLSGGRVFHNIIQDNGYNIYYWGQTDADVSYNWWGTTNASAIEQKIYDFHNDFRLGRVVFQPILFSPPFNRFILSITSVGVSGAGTVTIQREGVRIASVNDSIPATLIVDGGVLVRISFEDVKVSNSNPEIRWKFDHWVYQGKSDSTNPAVFVFDSDASIQVSYTKQYLLSGSTTYGKIDGSGWYAANSLANISISPTSIDYGNETRGVFSGWIGYPNQDSTLTIRMESPRNLTALWKIQYFVTVDANGGEVSGQGWYDIGSTAVITARSPASEILNKSRLVFTDWSGDSTSDQPSLSITINTPLGVKANWKIQNHLEVTSSYGEASGSGWYDAGNSASFSVDSQVDQGNQTRRIFLGWRGDTSTSASSGSVVMDSPKSITAIWKTQYYLTVASPYGITNGSGWYDAGTQTRATLDETRISSGFLTYKAFDHWTGDVIGTSRSIVITMNAPKSVAALWTDDLSQLYLLIVAAIVVVSLITVMALRRRR